MLGEFDWSATVIALDNAGNIWASVNERNAIVYTVFFGTSNSVMFSEIR
jgi:hypothetical protein